MPLFCTANSCDGKTKVMDTRGSIRRRKCLVCGHLFLTEEVEYTIPKDRKSPFTERKQEWEMRNETSS